MYKENKTCSSGPKQLLQSLVFLLLASCAKVQQGRPQSTPTQDKQSQPPTASRAPWRMALKYVLGLRQQIISDLEHGLYFHIKPSDAVSGQSGTGSGLDLSLIFGPGAAALQGSTEGAQSTTESSDESSLHEARRSADAGKEEAQPGKELQGITSTQLACLTWLAVGGPEPDALRSDYSALYSFELAHDTGPGWVVTGAGYTLLRAVAMAEEQMLSEMLDVTSYLSSRHTVNIWLKDRCQRAMRRSNVLAHGRPGNETTVDGGI